MEIKKIQITLLSELRGLVAIAKWQLFTSIIILIAVNWSRKKPA